MGNPPLIVGLLARGKPQTGDRNGSLKVHYQPQVKLSTGKIAAMEAMVR
jgi:sensor c-di-GMP phosphodiesterase-like protein